MGLFKTYSEKEVKRVRPLVNKINGLEEEISKLSDSELITSSESFISCPPLLFIIFIFITCTKYYI